MLINTSVFVRMEKPIRGDRCGDTSVETARADPGEEKGHERSGLHARVTLRMLGTDLSIVIP
jgi:hypothetical protein